MACDQNRKDSKMSDEGEIKKRISEKSEAVDARCGSVIAVPELYKMIEDAKKEYHYGMPIILFPEIKDEELRKFIEEALKLLQWTLQEKDKWFKKYFGEVTEE
jgi:hypothetical protein